MTAIVASDPLDHLGLSRGQHRTVFRNPRGNKRYYAFYVQNGDVPASPGRVYYEYSSDGVSWTNSPVEVIPMGFGANAKVHTFDVKMRDDGSQLEVWAVAIGYDAIAFRAKYVYGTISDASDTISWNTAQNIGDALNNAITAPHCIALARTNNGRIVVAFTEDTTDKGKDYRQTKLIGSDGDGASPSWSGETTWDNPSGSSNNQDKGEVWFGLESYDASYGDRTFLYARCPDSTSTSTYITKTAVPNWNGTSFTYLTQASWGTAHADSGWGISGLIDDADYAHLVYEQGGYPVYLYHRKAASGGDDNLGTTSQIDTSIYSSNWRLTITLDTGPAPDLLYVFYTFGALDWDYKTTPVGTISFSSAQTVSYHQAIDSLSSWNRQVENSLHIAGLYGTTVVYNEHPVYKALSTTLADLEFPDQNYYLGPHST